MSPKHSQTVFSNWLRKAVKKTKDIAWNEFQFWPPWPLSSQLLAIFSFSSKEIATTSLGQPEFRLGIRVGRCDAAGHTPAKPAGRSCVQKNSDFVQHGSRTPNNHFATNQSEGIRSVFSPVPTIRPHYRHLCALSQNQQRGWHHFPRVGSSQSALSKWSYQKGWVGNTRLISLRLKVDWIPCWKLLVFVNCEFCHKLQRVSPVKTAQTSGFEKCWEGKKGLRASHSFWRWGPRNRKTLWETWSWIFEFRCQKCWFLLSFASKILFLLLKRYPTAEKS